MRPLATIRRWALRIALGCAPLPALAAPPQPAAFSRFDTELGNIEAAITRLERAYLNPTAILRKFPNSRRIIDARVFFELGQFENAAMLLLDVVERPDFQADLELEAAQVLLGECLLKLDNRQGAREFFSRAATGRDPERAEDARLFLLELALDDDDDAALATALTAFKRGNLSSDRARLGLGKGEFRLGALDQAISALTPIPPNSPFFARSRYYLGAAYVARGDTATALPIFRTLTATEGDGPTERELRDQAWLAVGRILAANREFAAALTSYQNIDRNSPHYEDAVYEMAWAYINQERFDKALQTVEVLLLTVENDQREIDAHVLRGQLNVTLHDYNEASASYQAIVDRFAPIRNELVTFTSKKGDVQRYFKWLLEKKDGLEALKSPLSEKAVQWLASESDFSRVNAVFERVAVEAQDIAAARDTGMELARLLKGQNRVELFPDLRQGWAQALILENQLFEIAGGILDAQFTELGGHVPSELKPELDLLRQTRTSLERQTAALPTTFEAYDARHDAVLRRYRALERQHFLVQASLDEVQRQLLGIERYLNNRQFADGGTKLALTQEESLRADIETEKTTLLAMHDEFSALKRDIIFEMNSVGTGDAAMQNEQRLKSELLDVLGREGDLYEGITQRLGGDQEAQGQKISELRKRFRTAVDALGSVIHGIDLEVGRETTSLVAQVDGELTRLTAYEGAVGALDAEGRTLARRLGEQFFARALAHMDRVVLEADVGLLDVAWARKNEATDALQRVADERATRLRDLRTDLDSIRSGSAADTKGPTSHAPAPAPSEAPVDDEVAP